MNTSRKQLPRRPLFLGHRPEKGLHGEKDRHGNEVWYYREGHGPRTRIEGTFGEPRFIEAYKAAKWGRPGAALGVSAQKLLSRQDPDSLLWLIERYLASHQYAAARPNTQRQHRTCLRALAKKNGGQPFRALHWSHIKDLRDQIAERGSDPANPAPAPAMANRVISTLGVLFDWAIKEEKLMEVNPCVGVTKLAYTKTNHHCWTEEECDRFEAAYPIGTRERLAYALLSMTGQRSSDVVNMGPQHIDRQGYMKIKQEKTGKWIRVKVPASLVAAIDAGPTGSETFIASELDGKRITVGRFGNLMRKACDKVGISECTPHGLRHAAASRALDAGADVDFLMGVFGFSIGVAARYVQHAKLEKAAERGATHLERKPDLRVVA